MGGVVLLRQIELDDCTDTYVEWLNDPDVNRYLETRWNEQTLDSVIKFVNLQRENDYSILFAVIYIKNGKHIGNIKIGSINDHYKHADISYFIGDKTYWNKGVVTEAINLVSEFGFKDLKLHRMEAGVYADAIGSWRALEKNGFIREATFRDKVVSDGKYMDIYRYGLLNSEFKKIQYKEA